MQSRYLSQNAQCLFQHMLSGPSAPLPPKSAPSPLKQQIFRELISIFRNFKCSFQTQMQTLSIANKLYSSHPQDIAIIAKMLFFVVAKFQGEAIDLEVGDLMEWVGVDGD